MRSIVIEFKSGAFVLVSDLMLIEIFMDRRDWKRVDHIIYDGQRIEGNLVENVRGARGSGRVSYV